jgi:hypothetical protein
MLWQIIILDCFPVLFLLNAIGGNAAAAAERVVTALFYESDQYKTF